MKFFLGCLAWLGILTCSASAQAVDGYSVLVTYTDVGDGTTDVTIATTGLLTDISSTINETIAFSSFSDAVTPNTSSQGGIIDLVSIRVTTPSATLYTHTFDGVANDSTPAIHSFNNGVGTPTPSGDLATGLISATGVTSNGLRISSAGLGTSMPIDLSAETEFTVEFVVENNSSLIATRSINGAFFGITSSATSSATDGTALYNNAGSDSGPAIGLQVGPGRGSVGADYVFDMIDDFFIRGFFTDLSNDFVDDATCTLGDVDLSGTVDFLDIAPFIAVLSSGANQCEADCDQSGSVDFLDIAPFIAILSSP